MTYCLVPTLTTTLAAAVASTNPSQPALVRVVVIHRLLALPGTDEGTAAGTISPLAKRSRSPPSFDLWSWCMWWLLLLAVFFELSRRIQTAGAVVVSCSNQLYFSKMIIIIYFKINVWYKLDTKQISVTFQNVSAKHNAYNLFPWRVVVMTWFCWSFIFLTAACCYCFGWWKLMFWALFISLLLAGLWQAGRPLLGVVVYQVTRHDMVVSRHYRAALSLSIAARRMLVLIGVDCWPFIMVCGLRIWDWSNYGGVVDSKVHFFYSWNYFN